MTSKWFYYLVGGHHSSWLTQKKDPLRLKKKYTWYFNNHLYFLSLCSNVFSTRGMLWIKKVQNLKPSTPNSTNQNFWKFKKSKIGSAEGCGDSDKSFIRGHFLGRWHFYVPCPKSFFFSQGYVLLVVGLFKTHRHQTIWLLVFHLNY